MLSEQRAGLLNGFAEDVLHQCDRLSGYVSDRSHRDADAGEGILHAFDGGGNGRRLPRAGWADDRDAPGLGAQRPVDAAVNGAASGEKVERHVVDGKLLEASTREDSPLGVEAGELLGAHMCPTVSPAPNVSETR
jgi:hypothetical protein